MAWSPVGGEIMFVEASRMEGDGQLTLTGQLGDVMKESARLAISWLRTNAKRYQLTNRECVAHLGYEGLIVWDLLPPAGHMWPRQA